MALGFRNVFLLGGLCYAAALVSVWALIPSQPERLKVNDVSSAPTLPESLASPLREPVPRSGVAS
jgi:hypothetical protein